LIFVKNKRKIKINIILINKNMENLFGLLFFISLICLIVGLIKPTIFGKFLKGELTRKKIGKIFGISTVVFFVLIGVTSETPKKIDKQTEQQIVAENTQNTEVVEENKNENFETVEKEAKTDITSTPKEKETETLSIVTPEPTPTLTPGSIQLEQEIEKMVESVPTEYKSALNKATLYANNMDMSKQGVYDQLVSEYGEKFSVDAAQYAIDNVKANWNANALAKAKTYQDVMDMSPASIRDQLTSAYGEKFIQSEADYAIEHLND